MVIETKEQILQQYKQHERRLIERVLGCHNVEKAKEAVEKLYKCRATIQSISNVSNGNHIGLFDNGRLSESTY